MSQILKSITEITRCATQYKAAALAPLGLKSCHCSYLTEICADPGLSQDKLAQRICINKSNVARQAVFLEESGFITRRSCESDKRVMRLYPTEKALTLLPQITQVLNTCESLLTNGLSPEDMVSLCHALSSMKANAAQILEDV